MHNSNALNIYTDGSSYQHPRSGGFAMLFIFPEFLNKEPIAIISSGYKRATNNQMELKACCSALKESLKFKKQWQRIVLYTDCLYVCDNYKRAIYQWSKDKWRKGSGAPVLNVELWKELLKNMQKVRAPVEIKHVKGHDKNKYNEMVDKMAKKSAKTAKLDPLSYVSIRRKLSDKKVDVGCVEMIGQKITIRIISGEYLKQQKINKYKYEVISKNSPFYKNIDIIYSEKVLRVGHKFYVKFNCEQKFPQIEKIYRDITKEERKK